MYFKWAVNIKEVAFLFPVLPVFHGKQKSPLFLAGGSLISDFIGIFFFILVIETSLATVCLKTLLLNIVVSHKILKFVLYVYKWLFLTSKSGKIYMG